MKKENVNTSDSESKKINKKTDEESTMDVNNKRAEEEQDEDDDDGYTILPSNDSGITADDNAATGRMHEKEGE
jgi:hypothetical protein